MITITSCPPENAQPYEIGRLVGGTTYPEKFPTLRMNYDETGFNVLFTVYEKEPYRKRVGHHAPVHLDSCAELFLNFHPQTSDRYINFEVNANGAMDASFRRDRYDTADLKTEEIDGFGIRVSLHDTFWTVQYKIGFDFIKKYYPAFDIAEKPVMKGNVYKCGEETDPEHYISFYEVPVTPPDFHTPQFFGDFVIV